LIDSAQELKEEVDNVCRISIPSNIDNGCLPVSDVVEKPRHHRAVSFDGSSQHPASTVDEINNKDGVMLQKVSAIEMKWLALLDQRPELDDELGMSRWMDAVVSLSEQRMTSRTFSPISLNSAVSQTNSFVADVPDAAPELLSDVDLAAALYDVDFGDVFA